MQVIIVDHDADPDLARVDGKAAEAIGASCKEGPLACIQVTIKSICLVILSLQHAPSALTAQGCVSS